MKSKISVVIPVYNQEDLVLRAIKSIPVRDDIEIIVIDDGSTDNTWINLTEYRKNCPYSNLILLYNGENKGVSYTVNRGYDTATGEYVVLLGSDDYFNTDEFNKCIKELNGADLVYFNLEINDGTIWRLTEENKVTFCGSVKFMRREFIGDTRCSLKYKAGEDYFFYQDLLKKNPTEVFTNLTVKHYNFPREGSLTNLVVTKRI